jgi:hypothetical protein
MMKDEESQAAPAPVRWRHTREGACLSVFEFTFGLSAVILGLALAHMASTVLKLAMAGRRAPPVRFVE